MEYTPRFISRPQRGRHTIDQVVRKTVYERDNYTCQYCLKKFEQSQLTIEHIVAVSKGGVDNIINYMTACRSCNSSKRDNPLNKFIENKWDITIEGLPIHGDIIMDTPELDPTYRYCRQDAYYTVRKNDLLKGSDAYKILEKIFRQKLWLTNYGKNLLKRFPSLPGHVVASIPLVEFIEADSRKPIYRLLIEMCKSANTRAMIDDIVRLICSESCEVSQAIRVVFQSKYSDQTNKRFEQAKKRAGNLDNMFEIPANLKNIPVCQYDLLETFFMDEESNLVSHINGYKLILNTHEHIQSGKFEVTITKVNNDFGICEIAHLPEFFD